MNAAAWCSWNLNLIMRFTIHISAGNIGDLNDLTQEELLKLYRDNIDENNNEIQLTDQRKNYEDYRVEENEKDLEELRKLAEKEKQLSMSVSTLMCKYW